MKKIYTLFIGMLVAGSIANAQVVFQSNLSSWSGGLPTDWIGSSTNATASNITEVAAQMYGTSAAALKNTTTTHKRFSTPTLDVTASGTYEVKMWVKASAGELRTGYYNVTTNAYGTYNNYEMLATTSAGNLVMITQSITLTATCDSAQFILSFRSTDGVNDIIVDSVVITSSTPPVGTPVTINQIQNTTTPPFDSPYMGQLVETSGIVTATQFNGYYIQNGSGAYNGVFVLDYVNTPTIGDNVTIIGTVDEYFNYTTVENPSVFVVNSSGNSLPAALTLTTLAVNAEEYEGVLVKVTSATCTADTATNGNGEWTVNDGSGALIVDNKMFSFNAVVSTEYNVTGVVDYSFSNFKLLPRDANDVQISTSIDEFDNIKVSVYPNPVQNFINFEVNANNYSVRIVDITGKTVSNTISTSSKHRVNTANLNNGIYFYTIINNNGSIITTNKFVVAK